MKMENILVSETGMFYLTDFGHSARIKNGIKTSKPSEVIQRGTYSYLSYNIQCKTQEDYRQQDIFGLTKLFYFIQKLSAAEGVEYFHFVNDHKEETCTEEGRNFYNDKNFNCLNFYSTVDSLSGIDNDKHKLFIDIMKSLKIIHISDNTYPEENIYELRRNLQKYATKYEPMFRKIFTYVLNNNSIFTKQIFDLKDDLITESVISQNKLKSKNIEKVNTPSFEKLDKKVYSSEYSNKYLDSNIFNQKMGSPSFISNENRFAPKNNAFDQIHGNLFESTRNNEDYPRKRRRIGMF